MKPNGFDHPKIWEFAQRLGIRKREAWGIVDRFWDITAKYAERGDCGKLHDALVAERVDWTGDGETPEQLIDALLGSGLIDPHPVHRFVVHDWHDHAPDYVKKKCSGQKATQTREEIIGVGWAQDDEPKPVPTISQVPENEEEPSEPEYSRNFQNVPEDSGLPFPSFPFPSSQFTSASHSGLSPPPEESCAEIKPLANLLGKQAGKLAEKIRWLESGVGEEILAAAEVEALESSDPAKARSPIVRKITIARYRTYLKTDRAHKRDPPAKLSAERQAELRQADLDAGADRDRAVADDEKTDDERLEEFSALVRN